MTDFIASRASGEARLTIDHAGHVALRAGVPGRPVRAGFRGRRPRVTGAEGDIRLRYRSLPLVGWLVYWRDPTAEIALDPERHWSLRFDGGAASVRGDMRGLALDELRLRGGVKVLDVDLPAPGDDVRIGIRGGIGKLRIRRPAGVPVRVAVSGGAGRVELDGQRYGSLCGPVSLTTSRGPGSASGYVVEVAGGAGRIHVSTAGG